MSTEIKEILMEELETVTEAIRTYSTDPDLTHDERREELECWSDRLARVNKALHSLGYSIHCTQSEWFTLKMLVEFHEGSEVPVNQRDFENVLAKLRG